MTKKYYILLLVLLGFFLIPSIGFACEMKSGKSCCNKEVSNGDKKECCKNDSHSKNKKNEGCNGKCGHSNCITSSYQFSLTFFEMKFKNNNFDFSEKKQNYFNSKTNISSGFYSLWLIPKIS